MKFYTNSFPEFAALIHHAVTHGLLFNAYTGRYNEHGTLYEYYIEYTGGH
jgi:hypothetical protein